MRHKEWGVVGYFAAIKSKEKWPRVLMKNKSEDLQAMWRGLAGSLYFIVNGKTPDLGFNYPIVTAEGYEPITHFDNRQFK